MSWACYTSVPEQEYCSAWEQNNLSLLVWACLGVRKLFCHCWCGRAWVCIAPYLCQGARIWLCLGANYFVVLHRFMRGCACGCLGMPYICPGAGILLCLGSNYFVIVGVGVLGCALRHTSVLEQKFGSAWEQIILSSLMWACMGVHVGKLSGNLYFFFTSLNGRQEKRSKTQHFFQIVYKKI